MTKLLQLKQLLYTQRKQLYNVSNFKQYINIHYKITQLKKMIKQEEELCRIKYESEYSSIFNKNHFL